MEVLDRLLNINRTSRAKSFDSFDFSTLYPFQIRSKSRPSRFLFFGAAGHVIRIFLDMNVTSPEYLSG